MKGTTNSEIGRQNLFAFIKGIGLDYSHFRALTENGFDSMENLEFLTVDMAISVGIKNLKEAIDLVESKSSYVNYKAEHECSCEEALMNYERVVHNAPLTTSIIVQGAISKKRGKDEKAEAFIGKITSLSVPGKGLSEIVKLI